ncbi:response regulator [Stenotrophomonas sp. SAU14A_NAIMI4_5]|uniref:response regulator n=1 Tax=Stenotrophomonas sp. SAU14A_NAIMI4_5 TaxID=2072413 RepID=UPI000D53D999|nr:response regulator [Stenotrophomonas sp. SAU14A_NAIMI4_5]AWH49660.1 response regulator [Stenotrophomonas sp. SAU14A_NAIMI4_5]
MQKYGSERVEEQCLLLVEDQLDLAELVEDALSIDGSTITHAESVFEALSLLRSEQFDAAILDIELGDGVVFPVADRLAELGVPFLFASAVYDQVVPARHQKARFVAKPFHIPQLQEAVNQTLAQGRAARPSQR